MSERICMFCKHLEYAEPSYYCGYPEPAALFCAKDHSLLTEKQISQYVYDVEDFRNMIKTAENCKDYDQAG